MGMALHPAVQIPEYTQRDILLWYQHGQTHMVKSCPQGPEFCLGSCLPVKLLIRHIHSSLISVSPGTQNICDTLPTGLYYLLSC